MCWLSYLFIPCTRSKQYQNVVEAILIELMHRIDMIRIQVVQNPDNKDTGMVQFRYTYDTVLIQL